jgi:L-ascorbate metabolism protein UlaG (beta-lactamase superfamily)
MTDPLRFRWLGTAGIELECRDERILIDPYLSRFPLRNLLFGRPVSKRDLVNRYLSPACAVLVSHSHYDHLLDVPTVCREFGTTAYGSSNTGSILRAHEIPQQQIRTVRTGDRFHAGPFTIHVFPGRHGRILGVWLPYAGPLPARLNPPLRLSEYRMDGMLSFHIETSGSSILVWNSPDMEGIPFAEVLFCSPLWGAEACSAVAAAAHAKLVIPVHWDNFFTPLERAPGPVIAPPGWRSPWIRRMEPASFVRSMNRLLPNVKVLIPGILEFIDFN